METTIDLPEPLLAAARAEAAQRRVSLSALVAEVLRGSLRTRAVGDADDRRDAVEANGTTSRVRPRDGTALTAQEAGVDFSDNSALQDFLDEGVPIERLR